MRKTAFAPIVDQNSRILLLGTMPSEESLRRQEYYGHKSNQFWKIIFTLYNKPLTSEYQERVALLQEKGIALWDVLSSCEGTGSLDSNIINEQPNDFESFFAEYPQIKHLFFTSKKAAQFYKKYVNITESNISFSILPSPSPANARMSFSQKLKEWEIIKDYLEDKI